MKHLIALMAFSALALLTSCAPPAAVVPPAPVKVPAFSSTRKLNIRWVNEISTTTDTLFRRSGMGALREFLTGKEPVRFHRPHGVHVDCRGRIYVSDPERQQVHLFDPRNQEYRIIRAHTSNDLVSPLGLASDEADNLYITDSASGWLYRYNCTDDRLERFSQRKFSRPTGIAYDSFLQRLFVVDTLAHQVVALDLTGNERYHFGSRGEKEGEFNFPTDIASDRLGRILVNDTLNSRIQVFFPNGKFIRSFGNDEIFARAKGIATDSSGAIYVSDALTDMVRVFDFNGKLVASFGRSGHEQGEFWMPNGLFIDQEDRLYAADSYNKRIQIFEGLAFEPEKTRSEAP